MTRTSLVPVLGFLAGCAGSQPSQDILVVTIDTLRADRIGAYGGAAVTPNLDALARSGIRFDQCFSVVPTTLASHAAMFTGRYPRELAVPRNGFRLSEEYPTVGERLRGAGWRTAAFVSSFALDPRFGLDRGFDIYDAEPTRSETLDQDWRTGAETVEAALAWLDTAGPGPIFLWVHLFDPHFPYSPDVDHAPPASAESQLDGSMETITGIWAGRIRPSPADVAHLTRLYEAEISYADLQVGRLLEGFSKRRDLSDTWCVVTSDHGESLGEHDYFFDHGQNLYETDLRVPLLVKAPAAQASADAGVVSESPIRTLDLYASILDMASIKPEPGLPSRSWLPLWSQEEATPRTVHAEATKPHRVEGRRKWPNLRKARSIRVGDAKYIETPYLGRRELYSLSQDPEEANPLQDNVAAEALRAKLRFWESVTEPAAGRWTEPGEESSRRLEALGYID